MGNNSQFSVTLFSLIQKGTFAAILPFPSRWILDTPLPTIIKCPSGKSKDGVKQNTVYLCDELRLTRTERHYVESTTHNEYKHVNDFVFGQIGLNLVLFISKYNKMTSYYAVDRSRKTVLPGPSCPGKVSINLV